MLRQPVNFTLGLSGFTFTNIRLITTRETSMIRISILYPNNKGSRFDVSYYVETHMPISIKLLSAHPGFKGVSVEHGLSGAVPGSEPTYIAMCHFLFSSVEDFLAAFMPNAEVLQGDMPNYTDREPVIQFNEVLISR
ncbi:MAG: EthD family reductase [Burkholderiales bacterium]